MKVNYYIDYEGTLKVYHDNYILFEISDCKNMSDDEIKQLIENQLEESELNLLERIEEVYNDTRKD